MKKLLALISFTFLTSTAYAHPGSNKLVCKSANNSGSNQKVEVLLRRSNTGGWSTPHIEVTIDKKSTIFTTPDENNTYGSTFHNSPLKVITVTAAATYEENTAGGYFSVIAIPATVQAYDIEGKPVKWSLEAEKDECNDSHGKALFQGIIHGQIFNGDEQIIDTQILDCELSYNAGMAC
ncbi:MAG: hypothetical protein K2Q18_07905 [Bdellovibrionales bacterium]|nr:hypothetical protein [Bdellovibrionales bacterium]